MDVCGAGVFPNWTDALRADVTNGVGPATAKTGRQAPAPTPPGFMEFQVHIWLQWTEQRRRRQHKPPTKPATTATAATGATATAQWNREAIHKTQISRVLQSSATQHMKQIGRSVSGLLLRSFSIWQVLWLSLISSCLFLAAVCWLQSLYFLCALSLKHFFAQSQWTSLHDCSNMTWHVFKGSAPCSQVWLVVIRCP